MLPGLPNHFASLGDLLGHVPWLEFARPGWLLLVPLLVAASVWIASRALGGWKGGKQTAALIIRCLVITLLCAALAEPSINRSAKDVAVVVVRDVSRSVPDTQQRLADEFLRGSLSVKPQSDRLGVVSAAREAVVQSLPNSNEPRLDAGYVGDTDSTNLQQALALGRGLVPSDAAGRILLVSDGNQTDGDLVEAARAAAAAGIPIDVVGVEYDRSGMIRVREVVIPPWTREGETVSARVVIDAGRETSATLALTHNGEMIDINPDEGTNSATVQLTSGLNILTYPVRLGSGPVHRIEAFLEPTIPEPDVGRVREPLDEPGLLRATGVTFASTRARVLVLTDKTSASDFIAAIRADDFVVDVRAAAEMPSSLIELLGYDAVVLADVPASSVPRPQQEDLVRFVRDAGGGLLVLGGPDSFGAGGWIGSPLAEALPVKLDPPQKREIPMGALVLIIDSSGSMSAPVSGTKLNQQQIANEAAVLGVTALSRLDNVAVVAFSGDSEVVVPLQPRGDPGPIAARIRSIGPGGGTNLFPAIDAAEAELARSPAGVRHIVILSDGQTIGEPADGLLRASRLKDRNVTVSTVAIGDAADGGLLAQMAAVGGGRSYTVTSANSLAQLPQIFIKEAQIVRRTLIWEGEAFAPQRSAFSESLRGVSGPLPCVSGYVVTADRGGLSSILFRGPHDDPILAQWQHGVGRVTAYTSDASSRWNSGWLGWGLFSSMWKQQLRWVARPTGDARARVTVIPEGDRSRVFVDLLDDQGQVMNFARVRGRVVRADASSGQGSAGQTSSAEVSLRQTGPGRYEGDVDTKGVGVHLLALRYDVGGDEASGGTVSGTVRAAVVRRGGDEMARTTPDTEFLWRIAQETNGRMYKLDPRGADLWVRDHLSMPTTSTSIWMLVALMGIGLFIVDVAVRRIAVDMADVRAFADKLWRPSAHRAPEVLAGLVTARRRFTGEAANEQLQSIDRPMHKEQAVGTATDRVKDSGATAPIITTLEQPNTADDQTAGSDGTMSRLQAAKKRAQQK